MGGSRGSLAPSQLFPQDLDRRQAREAVNIGGLPECPGLPRLSPAVEPSLGTALGDRRKQNTARLLLHGGVGSGGRAVLKPACIGRMSP